MNGECEISLLSWDLSLFIRLISIVDQSNFPMLSCHSYFFHSSFLQYPFSFFLKLLNPWVLLEFSPKGSKKIQLSDWRA